MLRFARPCRSAVLPAHERGSPFRIFLVRHGQSTANVDPQLFTSIADHAIPLSAAGVEQSQRAGEMLKLFFERNYPDGPGTRRCRLWTSPYLRTRQTSQCIVDSVGSWITDVRESILLAEQSFGLFEGIRWEELSQYYPNEVQYYRKAARFGGRFWARFPLGESRADVCQRVQQLFSNIHRDGEKDIKDLIIVSHGVTLRAFLMMWFSHPVEWFEKEPNFQNTAIRLVEFNMDHGYVWLGPEGERGTPASTDPQDVFLRSDSHVGKS